jgi:hypothetical protein
MRNIITFIISLTLIENILVIKKIQEAFKNPYRSPGLYRQWKKEGLPMAAMLVVNRHKMKKICREPPKYQSYKVTIHWTLYFHGRE